MFNEAQPEWDRYATWCRQGAYARYVVEACLPESAPAQLLCVRQPPGRYPDPATPDLALTMILGGNATGQIDLGAGRFVCTGKISQFALAPVNAVCDYAIEGTHSLLSLSFSGTIATSILLEVSSGRLLDHGPLHASMNDDSVIASLMRRLWAEAADGNLMGPLLAEDTAVAISARLARMALRANGVPDMLEDTPPLHGARLTRVLKRIEDEIERELTQADLALVAGLSPWHFARAFKAATGVAPHRFVILRRLARSQWLLRSTSLSLAEIAAACGFSSHAHLTTLFRREVGAAPSSWRRSMRN